MIPPNAVGGAWVGYVKIVGEEFGHCGHPEAEERNRLARLVSQPPLAQENDLRRK